MSKKQSLSDKVKSYEAALVAIAGYDFDPACLHDGRKKHLIDLIIKMSALARVTMEEPFKPTRRRRVRK